MKQAASYAARVFGFSLMTLTVACGGGGGSSMTPTSPTSPTPPTGTAAATIRITSSGVTPKEVAIPVGGRVLFVNDDSRSHDMSSDPHPSHTDCPPIDQLGSLAPGQSRETGALTTARRCGFHDHDDPGEANLRGTIVIQ